MSQSEYPLAFLNSPFRSLIVKTAGLRDTLQRMFGKPRVPL